MTKEIRFPINENRYSIDFEKETKIGRGMACKPG